MYNLHSKVYITQYARNKPRPPSLRNLRYLSLCIGIFSVSIAACIKGSFGHTGNVKLQVSLDGDVLRSDYADAQADLELHSSRMSECHFPQDTCIIFIHIIVVFICYCDM